MTTVKLTREKSEEFQQYIEQLEEVGARVPQQYVDLFSMPDHAQEKLVKVEDLTLFVLYLIQQIKEKFE